jgi:hypothetical protein
MSKTKVIFRVFKKGNDVIALFPAIAGTVGEPNTCEAYQHVGQHGAASVSLMRYDTRPATHKEAAPLRRELTRIGYKLEVVKRFTVADHKERIRQLYPTLVK